MKKFLSLILVLLLCCLGSYAQKRYAVTDVSAAYLRALPDYESPLETQALMGAVMEVLDSSSYWVKVHLLDPDYTAWVNRLQIRPIGSLEEYAAAPKSVCMARYSAIYSGPSASSPVLRDLVRGDIVLRKGNVKRRGFRLISTPGGEEGWVRCRDLKDLQSLSGNAESVVDEALSYLGTPYLWGGNSVKGFDCSGLVRQCFFMAGILLPRNASEQLLCGEPIDVSGVLEGNWDALQPGDLLFFGNKETGRVSHVGIYTGGGHLVHSSMVVRHNSLLEGETDYYENAWRLLYARRIFLPQMPSPGATPLTACPLYF